MPVVAHYTAFFTALIHLLETVLTSLLRQPLLRHFDAPSSGFDIYTIHALHV
ncbi:MAG: hypothetical protein NUV63_14640 [Gallionella sp.]|nr:hypothetical protein [Gallionella sp.]